MSDLQFLSEKNDLILQIKYAIYFELSLKDFKQQYLKNKWQLQIVNLLFWCESC